MAFSPSVKSIAPLLETCPLPNYEMQEGRAPPAPLVSNKSMVLKEQEEQSFLRLF